MRIYKEKGIYGEDDVYELKTLEDFDEYERILKEKNPDNFLKCHPGFYKIKEEFKEYLRCRWEDKENLRYTLNGIPIYKTYIVVGIEDNYAMADWYWILRNEDDLEDIKYILANSHDLKNGLII